MFKNKNLTRNLTFRVCVVLYIMIKIELSIALIKSMQKFSKQLIQQCQKVISKKSGKFVSEDQAEIYLESFARLGLAALKTFDKKNKKNLIIKNK